MALTKVTLSMIDSTPPGVVFDGSTNNSTALQTLLNGSPGTTVVIPAGTANFSTALLWDTAQFRLEGVCPPLVGTGSLVGPCLEYTGAGTALTIGLAPDVSNSSLSGAQIESLRLQVATNTTIGLRTWECNGARFNNLAIYGNSGASRYGIKMEGGVDVLYDSIRVRGDGGASGVPANYLNYGVYVFAGFGGDPVTTTTFKQAYIHYCLTGAYVSGATTWYDSVLESNTIGFISSGDNTLINPWFENNLTTDLYLDTNSYTVIFEGRINSYARQQFFDGAGIVKLVVRNTRFQSSHASPRLFNPAAGSLAGSSITLDGNIFPTNFTINGSGGNGIDWRNVSVPSMTQRTLVFKQTGVATNTGYTMPQDNGTTAAIVMSQPGHILATRTYYTGATITAGTFDTAVLKNGAGVANFTSAALSASPGAVDGIQFRDKFVAGDTLQAYVHTSAGFLATGGQFVTEIIVSLGNDGVS